MANSSSLAVVLVTFNRESDLAVTLAQFSSMREEFVHLVVVDNCSTDGTKAVLDHWQAELGGQLHVVTLSENLGGAGGFHEGMKYALNLDINWIWMSDDDAVPRKGGLQTLMEHADNPANAYGSVAVAKGSSSEELCWPVPTVDGNGQRDKRVLMTRDKLGQIEEVDMLPFLGLMVSKKKALEIGLPNRHYFISGDDVEYCIRLQASGAKLIQVRDSVLDHPAIPRYIVRFLNREIYCLKMPAWRRYFDSRNRIWNSRLRGGLSGAIATACILLPRIFFTLIYEEENQGQISAYARGIRDGLMRYGDQHNVAVRAP